MMIILFAAALAAAAPASPQPADAQPQHKQVSQHDQHKGMDCCKDCCKDMAKMHEGHGQAAEQHKGHSGN